jgi:hypothetical protein
MPRQKPTAQKPTRLKRNNTCLVSARTGQTSVVNRSRTVPFREGESDDSPFFMHAFYANLFYMPLVVVL